MGRLFGTDGVRGVANKELTSELAMGIGRAAANVLKAGGRRRIMCAIGHDTRISSEMLVAAISAGLCSVGADVIDLGVVPTPAVAYLVGKYKCDMGIMISASHNPAEFNGIKIFSGDGYKLPDALEEKIEALVLDTPNLLKNCESRDIGKVTYAKNAERDYIDHLKSTVPYSLEGLEVAVDCANGSASKTAETLLTELGAKVHMMFDSPDGLNINDGCGSTHMETLKEYVMTHSLDAGLAFDGDADRFLCVDDKGEIIDGDKIMAICSTDMMERGKLPKKAVVGTIMSNLGFVKFCENSGIRFVATKVGDRFVLEEMLLEGYGFGGEQSGHIIFKDFATTGDGQLTAIQLLSILKRKSTKLSELSSVMTTYPQTMINLSVTPEGKLAYYTDETIKQAIENASAILGDEGRIVVRPSGTEPLIRVMVEGKDKETIDKVANDVATVITERLENK